MNKINEFIPVADVIATGILRRTALYKRINSGELPAFKVGSKTFVKASDVESLFKQKLISSLNQ
jgi:hypothetical protein